MEQPCCSPRRHEPLDVIFLNMSSSAIGPENAMEFYDVEIVTIPDLIVAECSCS
jgi:hypothetical protein